MTVRMPGFTAASSLSYAGRGSCASRSVAVGSETEGAILPQALNTGGGLQNQDPDWCDFKYALCMIGCSFKEIYWWFRFSGQVGVLPIACEASCSADRTLCRIT